MAFTKELKQLYCCGAMWALLLAGDDRRVGSKLAEGHWTLTQATWIVPTHLQALGSHSLGSHSA